MDSVKSERTPIGPVSLSQAERYRDGLMIAMLAVAPMRRASFSKLCLDDNVIKIAGHWRIYLPTNMVKTRVAQDFAVPEGLGCYLDDYIATYRAAFPLAQHHKGMWPYRHRPMSDKMVRRYVRKHTLERLGYAVSPHDFRRAAASFVAEFDPGNVRAVKDLLGHKSFSMTEKHYIDAPSSRSAGRKLAEIFARLSFEMASGAVDAK
jgi:integrase